MIENIKRRTFESTAIVLAGNVLNSAIRLVGNLILTRLLVPEMFGLMAIANVVILAVAFFSDVGFEMFLIRSTRELDRDFLNTVWTLNILRGCVLWGVTLIVAKPAALFYEEPLLCWMIPVIGFAFVLDGCQSIAVVLLKKKMQMGRLLIMEFSTKCIGVMSMVILAFFYRSVWAVIIGGLIASVAKLKLSFSLDRGLSHKMTVDKEVAAEMLHFGKWIFVSTAMTFLATQADRLLLGKIFPMALLGIYSIASGFAEIPKNLVGKVCQNVMFPLVSMYAHLERPVLREKILQKRKLLLFPMALFVSILCGFGDLIIHILYDDRYVEAGWILPLLAIGMWPLLLHSTMDRSLYVVGNPKHPAIGNISKFVYMVVCLPIAYHFTGKLGAILVIALNDLPVWIAISYGLYKKGLSSLLQDIWATLLLILLLGLVIYMRHVLGWGIPGYSAFHGVALF